MQSEILSKMLMPPDGGICDLVYIYIYIYVAVEGRRAPCRDAWLGTATFGGARLSELIPAAGVSEHDY